MAKLRKMLTHLGKNESGQGALAIVIILLMLGAIIITPLLVFMSTGIKAGGVYESKVQEFYAADAGVEDGLWQIKNDKLSTLFASYPYDPYNYTANYSYPVAPSASDHEINDKNVTVNITNVWIPSNIATPNPAVARSIIENGTLIVTGKVISTGGQQGYEIKISYYNRSSDDPSGTNLRIATIGAWLSGGFNYTSGSGNLSSYTSSCVPYCGGQAITWNLNNQPFKLSGGYPLVRTFTFNFTGPAGQNPQAVSWITTTGVSAIPYSWDADTKPYRITSTASSTTTEAYVIKNELRKLGGAISGDYVAIGGTLMTPTATQPTASYYRNRLYMESSATLASGSIPAGATIEVAYLYWSGWIDYRYRYSSFFGRWSFGDIQALMYPTNPTSENLKTLVNQTAKVDRVSFGIAGNMTEITADTWQVKENGDYADNTWSYSCYYDATDLVKGFIDAGEVGSNGAGIYTVKHVPEDRPGYSGNSPNYSFNLYNTGEYTGYPLGTPAHTASGTGTSYETRYQWAYAGWSLVIIYSSPETKGHQLYLFDEFHYIGLNTLLNFTISGFLAPANTAGSHLTYFVGEGDNHYTTDYIKVNNYLLPRPGDPYEVPPVNPQNNVFNSYSNSLDDRYISGIDIDTFDMSTCIAPSSTLATVVLDNGEEIYDLVYIILSFRSDITTGGTISYLIR